MLAVNAARITPCAAQSPAAGVLADLRQRHFESMLRSRAADVAAAAPPAEAAEEQVRPGAMPSAAQTTHLPTSACVLLLRARSLLAARR